MATEAERERTSFYACFLKAGGILTLDQFVKLPQADVRAMMDAGEVVDRERAALVAEAVVNRLRAAPAGDPLEAAARAALDMTRPR